MASHNNRAYPPRSFPMRSTKHIPPHDVQALEPDPHNASHNALEGAPANIPASLPYPADETPSKTVTSRAHPCHKVPSCRETLVHKPPSPSSCISGRSRYKALRFDDNLPQKSPWALCTQHASLPSKPLLCAPHDQESRY